MDGDFGDLLAGYIYGFVFVVGFFAFTAGASIATAICWWWW